jgi:hypothetical protein
MVGGWLALSDEHLEAPFTLLETSPSRHTVGAGGLHLLADEYLIWWFAGVPWLANRRGYLLAATPQIECVWAAVDMFVKRLPVESLRA